MRKHPLYLVSTLRDFARNYSGPLATLLTTTAQEIEDAASREIALRTELETTTTQRDTLAKVADKLLTDLENVVEGLDPEEARQVAEMREVITAAK